MYIWRTALQIMTRILKGGVGSVNPIVQLKLFAQISVPFFVLDSQFKWPKHHFPSENYRQIPIPILPLQLPPSSILKPYVLLEKNGKKRGAEGPFLSSVTRLETANLWFSSGEVRRRRGGVGGRVEGSCLPGHLTWKSKKSTDVWRLGDLISAEFRTDGKIRQPHVQMRLERHGYLGCTFLHNWHSRLG